MVPLDPSDSYLSDRVVQPQPQHQSQSQRRRIIIDANDDREQHGEGEQLICGEPLQRQLTMPGVDVDCGKHCERQYVLYIPSFVCPDDSSNNDIDIDIDIDIDKLPLVVALHCLGCTPDTMMHWVDVAETYQFVLIIPKGIHSSFNAQHCCGYALEHNVDDVGFLTALIATLSVQYSSFVSPEITYAMGWSNGGYMVNYAAHLFRAIAPISGFQVDSFKPTLDRPTGLFLHHAQDDTFVRIEGCCTDSSMPKCCCDLSTFVDQCHSAHDKFMEWSHQINHCSTDSLVVTTTISNHDVTCLTASGSGCRSNTTFCTHQHGGHFNQGGFARAFPMTLEIAEFFARDACSIHGGTWLSSSSLSSNTNANANANANVNTSTSGRCVCPPNRKGTFCLAGSIEEQVVVIKEQQQEDNNSIIANAGLSMYFIMGIFLVAGSMLFLVTRSRLLKNERRYHGFGKVSTVELPTIK